MESKFGEEKNSHQKISQMKTKNCKNQYLCPKAQYKYKNINLDKTVAVLVNI